MTQTDTAAVTQTTLDNGLTVMSEAMPHLATVALGVWVRAGARDEVAHENGLSHLLEHMAFKGTARRTAQQIVEAIEDKGGDLNAATSTEYTAYYVRALGSELEIGVDVLGDIILNPTVDDTELTREKDVILQEIAGIQDSPDDVVYDLMQDAAFTGHALGRPIIGTPETVNGMGRDHILAYRERNYRAGNMVVAAAGAVDHDELVALAETHLSELEPGTTEREAPPQFGGGPRGAERPFEQAHLLMSWPSTPINDPIFFAGQVFSNAFGGGMSSRLFQEARERRGLCYSIYTSNWGLSDTGLFMMHAATGEDMLPELADVMIGELRAAADAGLTAAEIDRAKAQLKTGLMMSLESPSARAEQLARQMLLFGRLFTAQELLDRVEAVTADEVREVASRLATARNTAVAVVGAGERSLPFAMETEQRIAAAHS
ncbi:MAG: pitrilysin family protein [Pseudomonadota bacterium]